MKYIIKESQLRKIIQENNNFPDFQKLYQDSQAEKQRKEGELDSRLFDEFYDNLKDKTFFAFQGLIDNEGWRDENDNSFTKNENKIISSFPTIDEINSWKDWVNSPYWESTHFYFSKRRNTELTSYGTEGQKTMKYHEEPTSRKKMYFEMYSSKFGPIVVKKRPN